MKHYAQSILQFSGYPLEPIVAREVEKSFRVTLCTATGNFLISSYPFKKATGEKLQAENWDADWFGNYE